MNKLVRLELKTQSGPGSKRTEIAKVIDFKPRQAKQKQTREIFELEKLPLSERHNFIFREIDPTILDRLDTRSWKCGDLEAIEARALTETDSYKSLRIFIEKLNAQQFFNYLFQVKIEELTPPQVQAILDEIDERS